MLTFIIVFFHFRCLAKHGSGVVQMEPLEASWLVRACVVLHNMCIDWGLQALKPEDSYDPEIELDIQQEAAKRFLRSLKQNRDRSVLEVRRRKRDREEYLAGVCRRNDIFHNHFGGPQPKGAAFPGRRGGRGRGRGARRGAGRGLVRGTGRGARKGGRR